MPWVVFLFCVMEHTNKIHNCKGVKIVFAIGTYKVLHKRGNFGCNG